MKRALLVLALLALGGLAALTALSAARAGLYGVAGLAKAAPRRTARMRQREREARRAGRPYRVTQVWVPYDRVSPLLRRAVLVAEDDAFYQHGGLDWNELAAAARKNLEKRRVVRGGSTITQQLAKNLYLGDGRTLTRKLTEVFLALRMERALSKRRIFELYLNLIEWGDGTFGAEAAARRYFGTGAADLTPRQAVLLAAVIINPRRFSVLHPPRRIERRVRLIAGRLRRRGALSQEQYDEVVGNRPPVPWWWLPEPSAPETTPPAPAESAAADTSGAGISPPGPP